MTQEALSKLYDETTTTIYNCAKKYLRTQKQNPKRDQHLYSEYRALRAFTFKVTQYLSKLPHNQHPDETTFLAEISKSTHKTISILHKHKIGICPIPTIPAWNEWINTIKNCCKKLNRQLRRNNYNNKDTQMQKRAELFFNNRKLFYQKHVYGNSRKKNTLTTIYDHEKKRNTATSKELHQTLIKEACAILQCPQTPPQDTPAWFKDDNQQGAKNIPPEVWISLMSPITLAEVEQTLKGPSKSPGHDGITRELLNLCCQKKAFLEHFTKLCNLWISNPHLCPTTCTIGRMALITKPDKSSPTKYSNKRPLTLQSEIAKTPIRIIAKRLQNILHQHPILHPAQQAYITGGSTDNILTILLNELESSHSNKSPLICLFHDVQKAFDRCQWWSIEKACQRLSIPPQFIDFVMTYLKSSKTFISTYYGPTSTFKLKNSVKQGCPLAGYLFIIVLDYLHSTLNNPTKQPETRTTKILHPPPTYIPNHTTNIANTNPTPHCPRPYQSLGFADDLSTIGKRLTHQRHATTKVERINYFQNNQLNPNKTIAMILDTTGRTQKQYQKNPITINHQQIPLTPTHKSFKFLGLHINGDLTWDTQISKIKQSIYPIISKFRSTTITYQEAMYTYKEVIVSLFLSKSKHIHIPKKILQKIDNAIFSGIINTDKNPFKGHHKLGFYATTRTLPLTIHHMITCINESLVNLTDPSKAGATTRSRASQINTNLRGHLRSRLDPYNRLTRAVHYLQPYPLRIVNNSDMYNLIQKRPLSHHLVQDFNSSSRLPKISWRPHVTNIIILTRFRERLSTWGIYLLFHPSPILKVGTHKSTDPIQLQLIATIFALEQVSSATSTQIYLTPFVHDLIHDYTTLTHREKMKNPYNFFLSRIQLLRTTIPYKTTFHVAQSQKLKNKLPSTTNPIPSTTLQHQIAAPQYYLMDIHNQKIITSYPRTYLKEFFHNLQYEQWCKKPTLQNTHPLRHPSLQKLLHNLPFTIRTESFCAATLNNRLPSLRVLHHIPPFNSYQTPPHQCLLCHCHHTHKPTHHFLTCPINNKAVINHLKTLQRTQNKPTFPIPIPHGLPNPYISTRDYIINCLTNNSPLHPETITSFFRIHHDHIHLRSIPKRRQQHCNLLRDHHLQFLSTLSENATLCYTDGSYSLRNNRAQSATIIYSPTSKAGIEIITRPLKPSPLEAELTAIYSTLRYLLSIQPTTTTIYIFTDSQESQQQIYDPQIPILPHTTLHKIQKLISLLTPIKVHIHWIGSHIGNSHHDRAHYLAATKISHPNTLDALPQNWYTQISPIPHPLSTISNEFPTNTPIPHMSTTPKIAKLIATTYINHIYDALPTLPPFTTEYITHCIPSKNSFPIPWHSNNLLITGLRTPYVWSSDIQNIPSNTLGFANPQTTALFSNNKWIPRTANQIHLPPMTPKELKITSDHIQQNLVEITGKPWSISFIYPSDHRPPKEIPYIFLHKILSYTTKKGASYTIWTFCNRLSHLLDLPLQKPLKKWARQHAHHKLHLIEKPSQEIPRRTISHPTITTTEHCNTALAQPHLQYLFPTFPIHNSSADPTLILLGYPEHFHFHPKLLIKTQLFLKNQYNLQCYRYQSIKQLLKENLVEQESNHISQTRPQLTTIPRKIQPKSVHPIKLQT